jgi:hypothetical protein
VHLRAELDHPSHPITSLLLVSLQVDLVEPEPPSQPLQRVPGLLTDQEPGAAEARLVGPEPLDAYRASAAEVLHHDLVQELPGLLATGDGVGQVRRDVHEAAAPFQ